MSHTRGLMGGITRYSENISDGGNEYLFSHAKIKRPEGGTNATNVSGKDRALM